MYQGGATRDPNENNQRFFLLLSFQITACASIQGRLVSMWACGENYMALRLLFTVLSGPP